MFNCFVPYVLTCTTHAINLVLYVCIFCICHPEHFVYVSFSAVYVDTQFCYVSLLNTECYKFNNLVGNYLQCIFTDGSSICVLAKVHQHF